jgi:hypothetical protein
MGYNAVQSVENEPKFRRNMSPPPSVSKNKPIRNQHIAAGNRACLAARFMMMMIMIIEVLD